MSREQEHSPSLVLSSSQRDGAAKADPEIMTEMVDGVAGVCVRIGEQPKYLKRSPGRERQRHRFAERARLSTVPPSPSSCAEGDVDLGSSTTG